MFKTQWSKKGVATLNRKKKTKRGQSSRTDT